MADSLILMVMALVVFGPRRLPQIGRQVGKLMYEFRKASNDFKFQMEEELRLAEEAERRTKEEAQRQLVASQPAPEAAPATVQGVGSPYPGEEVYPPLLETASPVAADEAPRIQPPSTGETVAARTSEPAADSNGASTPATEAVNQNG